MARNKGFFQRFSPLKPVQKFVHAIEDLFKPGKPGPPKRTPLPRRPPGRGVQPPPRLSPQSQRSSPKFRNPFADIWRDETGERAGNTFRAHFDLSISLPGIVEEDAQEQLDLWRDYIRTWVTGQMDRDEWSAEFGISLRDFDWEAWRTAMNYKRAK